MTDSSGNVLERLAFDPWGDRRVANGGGADAANAIVPSTTDRGFTGHEGLDAGGMGLVQMNGRIYDPTLGRFLSADPYVQSPYFSQSLNRYAYVWNRPLSLTDPSGYYTSLANLYPQNGGRVSLPVISVTASRWGTDDDLLEAQQAAFGQDVLRRSLLNRLAQNFVENLRTVNGASKSALLLQLVAVKKAQSAVLRFFKGDSLRDGVTMNEAAGSPKEEESKEAEKDLNGDCTKGCPNPNGRNGSDEHQAAVEDEERELRRKYADDKNVEVKTEVHVPTPGGNKENRYLDVAAVDRNTGQVVEGVQVGRETKGEIPVARERRALEDIQNAQPNAELRFRPYNR